MKKSIYFIVVAFALLTTFMSCSSPADSSGPKNPSISATPTKEGIYGKIEVPAGITNIEVIRKDVSLDKEHVCANINYDSKSLGTVLYFTDYFVEALTSYEYKANFISNGDWGNPECVTTTIKNEYGGYGLLSAFEHDYYSSYYYYYTPPAYNRNTNRFENMELKSQVFDDVSYYVNVAPNGTEDWIIPGNGINLTYVSNSYKSCIDISKIASYYSSHYSTESNYSQEHTAALSQSIDGYTIRVIPVLFNYDDGAWLEYKGVISFYSNDTWEWK